MMTTAGSAAVDPAEEKIRLLSAALQARDAGDYAEARRQLEALLELAPRDASVGELLARVRAAEELAERETASAAIAWDAIAREEETRRAADAELEAAGVSANGKVEGQAAPASPVPPAAPDGRPEVEALLGRARSQYLAGEPGLAERTLVRVESLDPANAEAVVLRRRIAATLVDRNSDRSATAAAMLDQVERAWHPAATVPADSTASHRAEGESALERKLRSIVLPVASFSGIELSRVVEALSAASVEFDRSGDDVRGVNLVLLDPEGSDPEVNLTVRHMSLQRVLELVTQSVGYHLDVQSDAVVVRNEESVRLETAFFPVPRAVVSRLVTRGRDASALEPGGTASSVPQAGLALSVEAEGQGIRQFLELAGVSFADGGTLAFDGSQLIVHQTPRNLERIRNILRRYSQVRQVEIEAKFMEVQDGALEELGVNWHLATKETQRNAARAVYGTGNRSLDEAFRNATTSQEIKVTGQDPIDVSAPIIPGGVNLAARAAPLATIQGILGEFNVQAVVRALAQKNGTELLSAPRLTVLSGNPATITVAQELRYPQSYGQVQSQVGTGSSSGGGSAGVTVTAGTPQEFTMRNIGVELRVTPTVEEDDHSISLDLNPRVTEFEGFVEYGGQSIAISQGTTVTVPSGFYQPVFAVRELTTKVTIWDGATLIMGGLTREDVRRSNDKVPVIGNVPVLGRLFRSNGESAQKRNLLIFVTANLVTPGGMKRHQASPAANGSEAFRRPVIVTPGIIAAPPAQSR